MWYFTERRAEKLRMAEEKRAAESALAQSQARLDQVEEQVPLIAELADRLRKIQQENHFAERIKAGYGA